MGKDEEIMLNILFIFCDEHYLSVQLIFSYSQTLICYIIILKIMLFCEANSVSTCQKCTKGCHGKPYKTIAKIGPDPYGQLTDQ